VVTEEVEEPVGLTGPMAEMDVGDEKRPKAPLDSSLRHAPLPR
jgi:hypothetical protein